MTIILKEKTLKLIVNKNSKKVINTLVLGGMLQLSPIYGVCKIKGMKRDKIGYELMSILVQSIYFVYIILWSECLKFQILDILMAL